MSNITGILNKDTLQELITGGKNANGEPNLYRLARSWTTQPGFAVVWFEIRDNNPIVVKTEGDIEGIMGYSHEEMKDRSLFSLIQPRFESEFEESVEALNRGEVVCKFQTAIRKDGDMLQTMSIVRKEPLLGQYVEFVISDSEIKKI